MLTAACHTGTAWREQGAAAAEVAVAGLAGQQRGEAQLGGVGDHCVLPAGQPRERGSQLSQPCQVSHASLAPLSQLQPITWPMLLPCLQYHLTDVQA